MAVISQKEFDNCLRLNAYRSASQFPPSTRVLAVHKDGDGQMRTRGGTLVATDSGPRVWRDNSNWRDSPVSPDGWIPDYRAPSTEGAMLSMCLGISGRDPVCLVFDVQERRWHVRVPVAVGEGVGWMVIGRGDSKGEALLEALEAK